jgi:hypothetical protein
MVFFNDVQLARGVKQVEDFNRLNRRFNGQLEGCFLINILKTICQIYFNFEERD